MKVRVLASSGVATGFNECLLYLPTPIPATVSIVLTTDSGRVDDPDNPIPLTNGIVRVHAFDNAGRSISNPGFVWFNETGQQIGRGHRLDFRQVTDANSVSVVATNHLSRSATATGNWVVEREQNKIRLIPQTGLQTPPNSPDQSNEYERGD